jgi:hypothetical protein
LNEAGYLDNLGWAALVGGDHERAKALLKEGLALCRDQGVKHIAAESLDGLASVAASWGEAKRPAKLFGGAQALREAVGFQQRPRSPPVPGSSSTLRKPGQRE